MAFDKNKRKRGGSYPKVAPNLDYSKIFSISLRVTFIITAPQNKEIMPKIARSKINLKIAQRFTYMIRAIRAKLIGISYQDDTRNQYKNSNTNLIPRQIVNMNRQGGATKAIVAIIVSLIRDSKATSLHIYIKPHLGVRFLC